MKKVQTGCIQTILNQSGKLECYKCTFPIPQEVASMFNYVDCQQIRNKWFYVRTSMDFEQLWYWVNLMQVTVNDYKVSMYEAKKLFALNNCVNYKQNKQ